MASATITPLPTVAGLPSKGFVHASEAASGVEAQATKVPGSSMNRPMPMVANSAS